MVLRVLITALLIGPQAYGQILGQGLTGTSGAYTNAVGAVGAVTNRRTSDLLSQSGMNNANAATAALASGNIGAAAQLGSQALTQYQQAVQTQNQSHEMGQTSLNGVNSGSNSGNFDLSKYSSLGVTDLNGLATTTSQTFSQAQQMAQSFGLSLSEDRQYIQTPVGNFPVNIPIDQMTSILQQIAVSKGVDPNLVSQGVAAGIASTQALAAQATAEVQNASASAGPGRQMASTSPAAASANTTPDGFPNQAKALAQQAIRNLGVPPRENGDTDWGMVAQRLAGYRAQLEKQMHLEPIGDKSDDIFKMIHRRYLATFR